ncbi:MAG: 2-oxo acid dehydrogenase subunit E2 [Planctomycetales bacterium]|nr:2-oxo acid dehydrogenase subunit E2 [Planctomycetales bacterium]
MAIEFKLPSLGQGVTSVDVGSLLVAAGDTIDADQEVIEIETEKAVVPLPCPHAGKIVKLHVKVGDKVSEGAVLLTLEPIATATTAAPKAPVVQPVAPKVAPPTPVVESSKPIPVAASTPASVVSPAAVTAPVASTAPASDAAPPPPAGPATRRMARELGVELRRVKGTGPGGRITADDLHAFVRHSLGSASPLVATSGAIVIPPLPDFTHFGPIERQPMSKLGKASAANLSLAWQIIPHVTQHETVDITELEASRKRFAQAEGAPKVTMTVLAMKAIVAALKSFPQFNSSYDATSGDIVFKRYFHIGVAVDTEHGLVVPVLRNVDQKTVLALAAELTDLSHRARSRRLQISDMQGGCFTITNLGGIGGSFFTPIVNYPEVAILGMSRATQQYVIRNGQPEIRLMLPLSLSYDHRVINGADAARFVVKLSGLLSDPFQLLSEA